LRPGSGGRIFASADCPACAACASPACALVAASNAKQNVATQVIHFLDAAEFAI
jgi:hypothetical protein